MNSPRKLPLNDLSMQRGVWNERMVPGEYAVHYSSFPAAGFTEPYCTVFSSLEEAEAHAQQQVKENPSLRCDIYDHEGLAKSPLKEICGLKFKDKDALSPRFRRWGGSILFVVGAILTIIDWRVDFELQWPAMIGVRLFITGFGLLLTEAIIQWNAARQRKRPAVGEIA